MLEMSLCNRVFGKFVKEQKHFFLENMVVSMLFICCAFHQDPILVYQPRGGKVIYVIYATMYTLRICTSLYVYVFIGICILYVYAHLYACVQAQHSAHHRTIMF